MTEESTEEMQEEVSEQTLEDMVEEFLPKSIDTMGNGQPRTINTRSVALDYLHNEDRDEDTPDPEEVAESVASAGYSPKNMAQAIGVIALRTSQNLAWAYCGQAVGLGDPTKPKSGASGARSRWNAATGKAGSPGSVATATAPSAVRSTSKSVGEDDRPVYEHQGGGHYELVGGTGEEKVRGKDNLPEDARVKEPAA